MEGHEETLELRWASIGHESHLQLINSGGSPCMPALLATEHGMVAGQGRYMLNGQDITQVQLTPYTSHFLGPASVCINPVSYLCFLLVLGQESSSGPGDFAGF